MKRFRFLPCLCVWLLLTATAFSLPSQETRPIPDQAAQKEARELIRSMFKDDYAGKKPHEKMALARTLLQQGHEMDEDPAARYVLFMEARDIAARAGDVNVPRQAIEALAASFEVDPLSLSIESLKLAGRSAKRPAEQLRLCEAYVELSDVAVSKNRYTIAVTALAQAEKFAKKAKDTARMGRIKRRRKEVGDQQREFKKLKAAHKALLKDPDDPKANLRVGRFECEVKGNWDAGLLHLSRGSDPELKALAGEELADPSDAGAQAKVGDGWWGRAQKEKGAARRALQLHAAHWYAKALPGLKGLAKARVRKRLSSLSIGFELVHGTWTMSGGGTQTKEGIVLDTETTDRTSLSAGHDGGRFDVGSKFEMKFRFERLDRNEFFVLALTLHPESSVVFEGMTYYGCGILNGRLEMAVKIYRDGAYHVILLEKTNKKVSLDSDYMLRLETTDSSFRVALIDAEGKVVHELKKDMGMPKDFSLGILSQNGKVTVTQVLHYFP